MRFLSSQKVALTPIERRAWTLILVSFLLGSLGQRFFPTSPVNLSLSYSERWSVNVNTASEEDLMLLPGIGPTLARRIVAHRPYQRTEDLLRVPGIGPKTFERIRPHVVVENPSPSP